MGSPLAPTPGEAVSGKVSSKADFPDARRRKFSQKRSMEKAPAKPGNRLGILSIIFGLLGFFIYPCALIGVILGTGTMSLAYMGLNTAISNIFHTQSFDLGMYMPDALFNSVNVGANVAVINAIVVSLVFIVLFMALTVKVFKSRDVK